MQRAVANEFAVDAVLADERLDFGRPVAKQFEQTLAIVGAEPLHDLVRRKPHAGVDQTDIAPRAAEADLDRLERDYPGPRFRKVQRRREPGIAATDNRDVGPDLAVERRGPRRRGAVISQRPCESGSFFMASDDSGDFLPMRIVTRLSLTQPPAQRGAARAARNQANANKCQ